MALDNRLVVYNEQGEPVDYDILASDVKFLPDGKDLPTKLAELEDEAGQGGYAPPDGGIPKTDLAQSVQDSLDAADSAVQPGELATVAKTGDYDDLLNKPTIPDTSGLATKTELADKQDTIVAGNGIVIGNDGKTVSVADAIRTGAAAGATAYQKPASGIPASDIASGVIPTLPQNIVQSVSVDGGTPATPDGNGNVDLTGLQMPVISISETTGNWTIDGQDTGVHAQGETGNITVTDGVVTFGLVNNLSSLDTDKGLTAKMGHDLLLLIAQIYDSLGASAFWSGKPVIDWSRIGMTYKTITRTLDEHCVSNKTDGRVLFGSQYSEKISGAVGYVLNSITLTMVGDANAQSYVNIDTGEINIPEVTGDITIVAAAVAGYTIAKNLTGASSSNTAAGVVPNAAFESKIDADNYWQMVDHDFTCVMGSTELPIVLEDGYPVDGSNWASNHVDIQTEDCVIWKCDLISAAEGYGKPYFQVSIKAVTGDIVITGKAVNVLQNNSLPSGETSAESGSVANRTGWIHTKRFPLPANINGSGDSTQYCWNFGVIGDNAAHFGCTFRTSQYLYSKTDDATYVAPTTNYDICCAWTCRQADGNAGYRSGVTRRTQNRTYRIVALSVHFDSISDTLMTKGAEVGSRNSGNWLIKAGRFLPPTE